MLTRTMFAATVGAALLAGAAAAGQAGDKKPPEDVQKAQDQVKEAVNKLTGGKPAGPQRITWIEDDALKAQFPNHSFFGVLFPQYPIGRQPPEPLKVANVYAVG